MDCIRCGYKYTQEEICEGCKQTEKFKTGKLSPVELPTIENPYIVNDYPYGFNWRTNKRYWIESKKGFGQRVVSQTLNPKTNKWNKPKKSVYYVVLGSYINEEGHFKTTALSSGGWTTETRIKDFEGIFAPLTEYQQKAIKYIRATNIANSIMKFEIKPAKEGEKYQTREEQKEIYQKAVNYGYYKLNEVKK